jgi:hypothetical protein
LVRGLGLRKKCTLFFDTYVLANSEILSVDQKFSFLSFEDCPFDLENKEINFKYELDYIFELSSIFSMSVKSRLVLNQKNGLFLSSGFDSTAVAYYAAKILSVHEEKFLTFTSYPYYRCINEKDQREINEKPLVEEFVTITGSIIPSYLDFPQVKFKSLLTDNKQSAFRPILGINDFWVNGIYQTSVSKGVKSFLNGQLGNNIISCTTSYQYLNYLISFKFLFFIQSIKSFLLSLIDKNSSFILRDSLFADLYRFGRRRVQIWKNRRALYKFPFLQNNFITTHEWKTELKYMGWSPVFFEQIDSRYTRLIAIKSILHTSGINWYEKSHSYGMIATDPTSDQRLVLFSLKLPQTSFKQRNISKYIYRKWMSDKSSKSILGRKDRIMQSADVGIRFLNDPEFLMYVEKCLAEKKFKQILDYSNLRSNYEILVNPDRNWYEKRESFGKLLSTISLISFFDLKNLDI